MTRKNAATYIFFSGMAVVIFSGSNLLGITAGGLLIAGAFVMLNWRRAKL